MKQLIANIRNKPQHHKNRIVLISLGVMIVFLLTLWAIVGMPPREGYSGEVINTINQDVEENRDLFPDLFPRTDN
ncbi:MAG TPA: hypothetical protein PKD79_01270 [Candidatus Doudnabacteria bacterium]|nr:hypothetical protein [Candidatus Doudnabacteria bacterium]